MQQSSLPSVQDLVDRAIVPMPAPSTPLSNEPRDVAVCPPLPAKAQLDPSLAEGACPWLDDYIAFSRYWSPQAYDHFHEAVGLWILSTVAAGRVVMYFGGKRYPSLYIALCARTSLYTKTTTAGIGLDTLEAAGLDWLLLGDNMTPQKFIHDLAGVVPEEYDNLSPTQQQQVQARLALSGQRGWFYDEFGQHLSSMMRQNGYMADFRSLLRRLADQQKSYAYGTISRGEDTVDKPYLSLLAILTPADLAYYARPGGALWQDGFYARFAFVAPPPHDRGQRGLFPKGDRVVPKQVVEPLVAWHRRLGMPEVRISRGRNMGNPPISIGWKVQREELQRTVCTVAEGVQDAYYAYHFALLDIIAGSQQSDLDGNYARLPEKALRIAMLMASLDPSCDNRVEMRHWARAQQIVERWRVDLHHLVNTLDVPLPSRGERDEDRVLRTLERLSAAGQSPTARELRVRMRGLTTPDVERILAALVRNGLATVSNTGRANRYRATREPADFAECGSPDLAEL